MVFSPINGESNRQPHLYAKLHVVFFSQPMSLTVDYTVTNVCRQQLSDSAGLAWQILSEWTRRSDYR